MQRPILEQYYQHLGQYTTRLIASCFIFSLFWRMEIALKMPKVFTVSST